MTPDEPPATFECGTCGNIGIGDGEIVCCNSSMVPTETNDAIANPSLEDLLRSVFEMSDTELEICLCVMAGGTLSVSELADELEYDRSVVSRHLNHLAELGVVEKQRRILVRGGHTYVYSPVPPERVRSQLRSAFHGWVTNALAELAALERKKVESIADTGDEPAWEVFRTSDGD